MRTLLAILFFASLCVSNVALICAEESRAEESRAEESRAEESRAEESRESFAFFEEHIRPTLVSHCIKCHGEKKQKGGLRLDSREALLRGGESGEGIVVHKPEESLLLEALRHESFEMPPSGPLPRTTIANFETWIATGAVWPETSDAIRGDEFISDADRQWWAFQPVRKVAPPIFDDTQNPIDAFVTRKLANHGMQLAPRADESNLIRRLYFDLIGLPPSLDEIQAFHEDRSPEAWANAIDRLLDDPRYGEHWARHWLDLVRYSESDGWNQDAYRPLIYRYRDYVVDSFNQDKPYPEFVREQIAGDEIPGDNPEHLVAAGYLRLGIYEYNQRDSRGLWNDIVNEMTDVTGDAFLGLSMSCCRCHDHKFDPLPQTDYFKLRAFFEPVTWRDDLVAATESEKQAYAKKLVVWEAATQSIRDKIDTLLEPYHTKKWESTVDKFPLDIQACFHMPVSDRTSWQDQMAYLVSRQFLEEGGGPLKNMKKEDKERHEALKKELAAFDELKPKPLPAVMTATEFSGVLTPTIIPDVSPRVVVEPGFLEVMSSPTQTTRPSSTAQSPGRRTRLASWIGDSANPLTTRVIVNRIWQQHFGTGIVSTPSDFGANGSRPTHPELLDWLAATFVEEGWSMKRLHRRILLSETWRQSANHPNAESYQEKDPAEQWLWRFPVRRLHAEQIRDAMLVASGELIKKTGGPSVDEKTPRRALYVKSFRNKNDTLMHGFDIANGLQSMPVRDSTTTPTQALLLFNGDYVLGRAKKTADRILAMKIQNPEETLQVAFQLIWGREPTEQQLTDAIVFVDPQFGEEASLDAEKLADLCHILFNSNQFLYVE